jgi:hypothetical protein
MIEQIFKANKLSNGNLFNTTEVILDKNNITVKKPGLFTSSQKTIKLDTITSVEVHSSFLDFSRIVVSAYGLDNLSIEGFSRRDAEDIAFYLNSNKMNDNTICTKKTINNKFIKKLFFSFLLFTSLNCYSLEKSDTFTVTYTNCSSDYIISKIENYFTQKAIKYQSEYNYICIDFGTIYVFDNKFVGENISRYDFNKLRDEVCLNITLDRTNVRK